MRKPIGLTSFLIQPAHFPHPNESFDNILQNIIPQWPSRCYHLVLSKQAPRLACFHSRHVHHLLMETHVREPVPQSRKVEARLKNPDQKQAFPMNFQIRVCFLWLYGSNFCICLDDSLVSVETRCGELPFFFVCVDFIRQNTQIQTCFFFVFGIMFSWRSVWLRQVNRRLIPLSLSHCKCYIHVPKSTEQQQLLPLYGFSFKAGPLLHGALVSQGLVPPCG